jgi:hypothetical protein
MAENTVRRDTNGQAYRIRTARHEWATIVLFGWQATGNDGTPRECGEILIHSGFGSWAHSWGHLGMPFKAFLCKAERSYIAGKFMGADAYKFDGQLTVRELRKRLLRWRHEGQLNKEDARQLWNYIEEREDELESSTHDFVGAMQQAATELVASRQLLCFVQEPWEHLATSIDLQFAGFWREVWPVFLDELRAEEAVPA